MFYSTDAKIFHILSFEHINEWHCIKSLEKKSHIISLILFALHLDHGFSTLTL